MDLTKKLHRSDADRRVAGVAGGLGEYLGVDPTFVRALFLASAIFGGAGLVLYVALWAVVPRPTSARATATAAGAGHPPAGPYGQAGGQAGESVAPPPQGWGQDRPFPADRAGGTAA